MSAVILAFPMRSPTHALARATDDAAPFTSAWCAQHLPLVAAAMDLLKADDAEFGRRFQLIRDWKGERWSENSPVSFRGWGRILLTSQTVSA